VELNALADHPAGLLEGRPVDVIDEQHVGRRQAALHGQLFEGGDHPLAPDLRCRPAAACPVPA
jgi:hypothetical protein